MTFVARYHGLSQMGSDLMSSLGWLVPSTTYDRGVVTMVEVAKDNIRLHKFILACVEELFIVDFVVTASNTMVFGH